MKRVSISIISVFICCGVVASLSASMLAPVQFPKTADDLTFGQRVDLLADGYRPFDTVFDSNGVCIENCPYVGITIQDFEKQIQQTAQQVQQELAELNMQVPVDPDESIQGTVAPSDKNAHAPEIRQIDAHIANYLTNYVQRESGVDITNNTTVQQRLNEIAVNVRNNLVNNESANVSFEWLSQIMPNVQLSSVTLASSDFDGDIKDFFMGNHTQSNSESGNGHRNRLSEAQYQDLIEALRRRQNNGSGSGSNPPTNVTPPSTRADIPTSCPLRTNPVSVSSEMGWRSSFRRNHNGMDLRVPEGTPVYAAADGRVVIRKNNPDGYGYYLSIQHDRNYYTVYGHLSKWLVQNGDTVRAGQQIAKSGNTGRSTGPHLHFEVLKNAPLVRSGATPVNPRTITRCTWSPKNNNSNTRDNRR